MLKGNSLSLIAWYGSAESISLVANHTRLSSTEMMLIGCKRKVSGLIGLKYPRGSAYWHSLVESVSWASRPHRVKLPAFVSCVLLTISWWICVFSLVGTHLTDWISVAISGCDHDQLIRNEAGTDQEPRLESTSFSHLESHCLILLCIFKQNSCIKKEGISVRPLKWSEMHLFKMYQGRYTDKKKIQFSSYVKKFRGIGCKVMYD